MGNFSSSMHLLVTERDIKNIKNVMRFRDSRTAKSREQDRDDSIKQPDPTYL